VLSIERKFIRASFSGSRRSCGIRYTAHGVGLAPTSHEFIVLSFQRLSMAKFGDQSSIMRQSAMQALQTQPHDYRKFARDGIDIRPGRTGDNLAGRPHSTCHCEMPAQRQQTGWTEFMRHWVAGRPARPRLSPAVNAAA
jgi:hypothetical protein